MYCEKTTFRRVDMAGSPDATRCDISVLLLLPDKVLRALSCLTAAPIRGVRFVACDQAADAEAASTFDHIVHKAAHDSVLSATDAGAAARGAIMRSVVSRGALIESLERVAFFADRGELCSALQGVVQQPPFLAVRQADANLP